MSPSLSWGYKVVNERIRWNILSCQDVQAGCQTPSFRHGGKTMDRGIMGVLDAVRHSTGQCDLENRQRRGRLAYSKTMCHQLKDDT